MSDSNDDQVVIRDRAGRRRFIRNGAAFLVATSTLSTQQAAFADDCDRNQGEKNPDDATSDSDSGASADAPGCGKQPKAKITRFENNEIIKKTSV